MPEPEVQRQSDEEKKEKKLQTKELSGHVPKVTPRLESGIHGLKGSGQPLPESVRDYYEPRFGYDFGQVRIHHSETETAHALKARAFTVGQDIVFGSGQYSPRSAEGRKLLAHELMHTIHLNRIRCATYTSSNVC